LEVPACNIQGFHIYSIKATCKSLLFNYSSKNMPQ